MQSVKLSGKKHDYYYVRVKVKLIVQQVNGLKYQNHLITGIYLILLITWLSCPLRDDDSFQEEGQAAQHSGHS